MRTLAPDPLPQDDCHVRLREQLVKKIGRKMATSFSMTISWEWRKCRSVDVETKDSAIDFRPAARV